MADLRRASEVLEQISQKPPGTFTDEDVDLTCLRGEIIRATDALVTLKRNATVYECRQHHRPLLTITPVGDVLAFNVHQGLALHVRPGTGTPLGG